MIRRVPFDFSLQRQSTLVRASQETLAGFLPSPELQTLRATRDGDSSGSPSQNDLGSWPSECLVLFCKGSLDAIEKRCLTPPSSGVRHAHDRLALKGAYVVALAFRVLSGEALRSLPLSADFASLPAAQRRKACCLYAAAEACDREALECDLTFLGLASLKNDLRTDAVDTVRMLQRGNVRPVMITGDSLLTASAVALRCQMVSLRPRQFTANDVGTAVCVEEPLESRCSAKSDARTSSDCSDKSFGLKAFSAEGLKEAGTQRPLLLGVKVAGSETVQWTDFASQQPVDAEEVWQDDKVRACLLLRGNRSRFSPGRPRLAAALPAAALGLVASLRLRSSAVAGLGRDSRSL